MISERTRVSFASLLAELTETGFFRAAPPRALGP